MLPLQTDEIRYDIMVERLFPDYHLLSRCGPFIKGLRYGLPLNLES
jgi:hypothetical protein